MFKRFGFFIIVNILIITVLTIITNLLGLEPYMQGYGINYQSLAIFCLVWGTGGSFISLLMSKWMAKKLYGVRIIDDRGPYSRIVQKVNYFAKKAGLEKMPEVGIYDAPDMNAFATGPSKSNSLVAVSSGLLNQMTEDEVDGVLAHEVAHIANGDMVTMTLLQGIMNAFVMFFARVIAHLLDNALRDDEGRGGLGGFAYFGVVMVLQITLGLLAQIVVAFFSRYREFRADEGGAKLAGRESMVNALKKLQARYNPSEAKAGIKSQDDQLAAFKISGGGVMKLFSTHPPLEDRIKALS